MSPPAKTAQRQETQAAPAQAPDTSHQQVAVFQPPRLAYPRGIEDRFGIKASAWKVLVEATFPSAKAIESIVMALSYCEARKLDIFKRPVHIVPMWDSKRRAYVETVWPGITEIRITAARTGNYAGCDEAEFGPTVERTFTGKIKRNEEWVTQSTEVEFPEWCRMTVYRMLPNGQRCRFVGPKVKWLETYATIGSSDLPNEMWKDRSEGQLEKCAEAAALRRAFPEELGNEYIAEEMAGRRIFDDQPESHVSPAAASSGPPSPEAVKSGAAASTPPDDVVDVVGEEVEEAMPADSEDPAPKQPQTQQGKPDGFTADERDWLREVEGAMSGCEDLGSLGDQQNKVMMPAKPKVSAAAWNKAKQLVEAHSKRITEAA